MVAARPTGTVTFLFTDLHGSTRLWVDHPDEMRDALARHDEILGAVIADHDGYVFTTAGDLFAAAFHTPDDAVGAARAAHRALRAESFDGGIALEIRVGLHAGVADERDGDYFGLAPTTASRIMAVTNPGQVVASSTVVAMVPGLATEDLGEHRLRDLRDPVRLHEIPSEDGRRFPPLRSMVVRRGNLPVENTSFVGREDEVEDLLQRLEGDRLITIVGVGGTGKTRLAVHVAREAADRYPDGAWLVELGLVIDEHSVDESVLAALRIAVGQGQSARERLLEALSGRDQLIVLDNCEHVIDAAAEICEEIVRGCPGVGIVATSREPLRAAGEHVVPVSSLAVGSGDDLGPAEQLFVERVRSEGGGEDAALDDIRTLCRRLDGIPLAIELAAARTRSIGIGDVIARLDERFRLLTGGRRTAVERHRTLQAAVAWSYGLLTDTEQKLFARLSVFVGSFDVEAAAAVGNSGGEFAELDVLDALANLVDKSMVLRETVGSYRLLETMRAFGRERLLEREESDQTASAHAAHHAEVVRRLDRRVYGPDEATAAAGIEAVAPDVHAAIVWSAASGRVDQVRNIAAGLWAIWHRGWFRPSGWIAGVADRAMQREDWLLEWLVADGFLRADRSAGLHAASELRSRQRDGTTTRALSLVYESFFALVAGDVSEALAIAEEAVAVADEFGDVARPVERCHPRFALAVVLSAVGTDGSAVAEEVIAEMTSVGWATGAAYGYVARSMSSELKGADETLADLRHALELASSVESHEVLRIVQMRMVSPSLDRPVRSAAREAADALALWVESGNWLNFRMTLDLALPLLSDAGRPEPVVIGRGFLDGSRGADAPPVRERIDTSTARALEEVGGQADVLTEQGRRMSNSQAADFLIREFEDLAGSAPQLAAPDDASPRPGAGHVPGSPRRRRVP